MTDRKECDCLNCPRPANDRHGQCDLHDAIDMASEANDLIGRVLRALEKISRKDREVDHD